ncbi:hypothetical protein [Aerosakkonema funiforme]|uniref:hypothetical protein n=1 Tax=Aerosakkonema funiforme TaxID=1246630 RepID=UPI0035BA7527
MFPNSIFETFDDWFNSESTLQEDSPSPELTPSSELIQEVEIDLNKFTGDKDPTESGRHDPPRTGGHYQSSNEDSNYSAACDDTASYASDTCWNLSNFDGWGNPETDADCWQRQESSTSCAVVAQIGVYESITGLEFSEVEACRIAQEHGWYDPESGTSSANIGKFLEYCGIPTEQRYDATLVDIADALERGDKVIVGLDANEIWYPARDPETGSPIEQSNAGHAVWITGIDPEPDGSVKVILNDSGTPDGRMKVVDAEDFLNAWGDYGNLLVVADAPEQSVWAAKRVNS